MKERRLRPAIVATTLATLLTSTALAVDSRPTDELIAPPAAAPATPVFDSGFVVIAEDRSNDEAFIVIAEDHTNDAGFLRPVPADDEPANPPPLPTLDSTP